MKRIIIIFLFLITACMEQKKEIRTDTPHLIKENGSPENISDESLEAEQWLKKSIGDYFKSDPGNQDKIMQHITTEDYYAYKSDAMNVDMDVKGSLTKEAFYEKWRKEFDVQKAGINTGFLITGQDLDEIKISFCKMVLESKPEWWFDIVLSDEKPDAKYPVRIEVIKENGSFLIADVWQEEAESN